IVIRLLPAPGIEIRIEFLICSQSIIAGVLFGWKRLRRIGLILNASPRAVRIHGCIFGPIGLKYETSLVCDLRNPFVRAVIPNHGPKCILTRAQFTCDIDGLIAPMRQVAARRTPRHALAIYVEFVPVVPRNMNDKMLRLVWQIETAPKM